MAINRPHGERSSRYQDVNSAETRAAYRRNLYLMLAAAVGIALSLTIPRMCPAGSGGATEDQQTQRLQRNLAAAFDDYEFDAKSSTGQDGEFRCTVYVIVGQGIQPMARIDAFEKAAYDAYGDRDGEVVWRFYRESTTTAVGDPAFIGLHRSDLRQLAERY